MEHGELYFKLDVKECVNSFDNAFCVYDIYNSLYGYSMPMNVYYKDTDSVRGNKNE